MEFKQSDLEKAGQIERAQEVIRNDYGKNDQYSAEHIDAKSIPDEGEHPERGKGTGNGYTHSMPQPYNPETKNKIKPQLDTANGGGKYDVYGYNDAGGRNKSAMMSKYSAKNPYYADGKSIVDTSGNVEEGQYVVR